MSKLNRSRASTLFQARTRMLNIKNNFRNLYNNTTCRACGLHDETQHHILSECKMIHTNNETIVNKQDLFNDNIDQLRITADKVQAIMDKIENINSGAPHNINVGGATR